MGGSEEASSIFIYSLSSKCLLKRLFHTQSPIHSYIHIYTQGFHIHRTSLTHCWHSCQEQVGNIRGLRHADRRSRGSNPLVSGRPALSPEPQLLKSNSLWLDCCVHTIVYLSTHALIQWANCWGLFSWLKTLLLCCTRRVFFVHFINILS